MLVIIDFIIKYNYYFK